MCLWLTCFLSCVVLLCSSFKGAERRRWLELAKINRPQPVKSAERKGRVHRFAYTTLIDQQIMLPILKDPKRGSPLPWCWYANCACFYSGGYAEFCAHLVFEFITSPKLKLDQVLMKVLYVGNGNPADGDLLLEDILSIAVLETAVQGKPDVTYVIRYNYFGTAYPSPSLSSAPPPLILICLVLLAAGDPVPITTIAPTDAEKAKEAETGSADNNKTPEVLLVFKCAELKELLEELRPQHGEFEYDTAKGKASEMLGKVLHSCASLLHRRCAVSVVLSHCSASAFGRCLWSLPPAVRTRQKGTATAITLFLGAFDALFPYQVTFLLASFKTNFFPSRARPPGHCP